MRGVHFDGCCSTSPDGLHANYLLDPSHRPPPPPLHVGTSPSVAANKTSAAQELSVGSPQDRQWL